MKTLTREKIASLISISIIFSFQLLLVVICYTGDVMADTAISQQSIENIPIDQWRSLANKNIYFGHQSVGASIIDSMQQLIKKHDQIKLNFKEIASSEEASEATFMHSTVGKNRDPESKIHDFETIMTQGVGKKVDIALVKFCFIDIGPETDIQGIFSTYKKTLNRLKQQFPETIFVHVTVPLKTSRLSLKSIIKKLFGSQDIWEYDRNIKSNEYNQILRNEYKGIDPIYDLAEVESTYPNGSRASFTKNGKTYYFLVSEYSTDGGHLSLEGRMRAAEQLLILLADISTP